MVLCVHGEVTHADVDIFDRERFFIDRVLARLVQDYPALRIVFEHIMSDLGRLANPITLVVENGLVTRFEGGAEARQLETHIEGVENARNIAELGIGLNPKSRLSGEITEVKKKLGTAHMAIGDSAAGYGGKVVSDIHLDGMILDARITLDGEVIVADGRVLV